MPFEHGPGCGFKLGRLALKIGACPALRLRCIARQLHAVDGEHFAANQTLLVADEEYLTEDRSDVVAQR